MKLSCGLLGLPNVGKSTLFNALMGKAAAEAQNFPFCTIEPNKGLVSVPDDRLEKLASLSGSASVIPSYIEVVDIAGLVKGASKGEGLGNQFLGHVREVDALLHVVRCFDSGEITHVHETVDPLRDSEIIETELLLADLESLEKRLPALQKKVRHVQKELAPLLSVMEKVHRHVADGQPAREVPLSVDEAPLLKQMGLLTAKPLLYVFNVAEDEVTTGNAFTKALTQAFPEAPYVMISAAIEAEIAALPAAEQGAFLAELQMKQSGIQRMAEKAYGLLGLQTYFTTGPKETHAWAFPEGSKAPEAAGLIHTDFERGFIAAEVCHFDDFIALGGEAGAKTAGKMRVQGKDYVMQDGDVVHFRFNV